MSAVNSAMGRALQAPRKDATAKIVDVTVRGDGVAIVTLDDARETHNTITPELGMELAAAIDRIEADDAVSAAVLVSGKRDSFVVGANIDMLQRIKFATDAERMARELAHALARLSRLRKPFVAAVHGPALGGGFELALACHAIVMSDDANKSVVGLPEVKLGLMPAANGMLRVAERAGLRTAIDLALTGRSVRAAKAKALGLLDEVCAPAILVDVGAKLALSLVGKVPAKRTSTAGGVLVALLERNPIGRAVLFARAREETRKKTLGHYPATERILDVLERYGSRGFASAAALEAKYFGELVVSETAHRMIEIFFATTSLKKDAGVDDAAVEARAVRHATILGGGLMGGGIAYVTTNAGIAARLKEKDVVGIGRGLKHVRGLLDERVTKRQLSPLERDKTFALLTATTDFSGMKLTDVVIEAVFEELALKRAILHDVEAHTKDDCIFASNTSSIPIGEIAEASRHPETVVGMHYFSPVHKMPLLEVIRTAKTAPWGPIVVWRLASISPRCRRVRSATRKLSSLCSRTCPTSVRAKRRTRISARVSGDTEPPSSPMSGEETGECGWVTSGLSCHSRDIDSKELLPDAELISRLEGDLVPDLNESAVRRAQVREEEPARIPLDPNCRMTTRQKGIFGEDHVARLSTKHRLRLPDVENVSRDPLHRALAEASVPRRSGATKEQGAMLRSRTEPFVRVVHNLKP